MKFKRDGNKLGRGGSWKAVENERHMHTFMADDVVDASSEVQLKWLMDLLAYGFIKLNGNDCNHGDKIK